MLVGTLEVDQILIELGETPFKLLKEEQEDGVVAYAVGEKQGSALITKVGLFDWNVMPFGMENATNLFSRTMIKVFE